MGALQIVSNYREDHELKQAFFDFTPQALYGASFVEWDRLGFWNERYIPYSLVEQAGRKARIVANVSVSRMRVLIQDTPLPAIQFATVGTLPEYRGRGYAARLMQHVLEREACDFCFLYANASVSEFYPKFGFRQIREAAFYSDFKIDAGAEVDDDASAKMKPRRLQLKDAADLALLKSILAARAPVTRGFGALDYEHILPFYAVYAFGEDMYLFASDQESVSDAVLIVAQNEGPTLNVYDIVCGASDLEHGRLRAMFQAIASPETREIRYHFTPELVDPGARARSFDDSDAPFFVRGNFPAAALGPFKFPALAQT
ncbi:MAG: GNAT family N-acetyltransferase [bacterium]|nr:GNAT family N-acetyltransferase [bacterium]